MDGRPDEQIAPSAEQAAETSGATAPTVCPAVVVAVGELGARVVEAARELLAPRSAELDQVVRWLPDPGQAEAAARLQQELSGVVAAGRLEALRARGLEPALRHGLVRAAVVIVGDSTEPEVLNRLGELATVARGLSWAAPQAGTVLSMALAGPQGPDVADVARRIAAAGDPMQPPLRWLILSRARTDGSLLSDCDLLAAAAQLLFLTLAPSQSQVVREAVLGGERTRARSGIGTVGISWLDAGATEARAAAQQEAAAQILGEPLRDLGAEVTHDRVSRLPVLARLDGEALAEDLAQDAPVEVEVLEDTLYVHWDTEAAAGAEQRLVATPAEHWEPAVRALEKELRDDREARWGPAIQRREVDGCGALEEALGWNVDELVRCGAGSMAAAGVFLEEARARLQEQPLRAPPAAGPPQYWYEAPRPRPLLWGCLALLAIGASVPLLWWVLELRGGVERWVGAVAALGAGGVIGLLGAAGHAWHSRRVERARRRVIREVVSAAGVELATIIAQAVERIRERLWAVVEAEAVKLAQFHDELVTAVEQFAAGRRALQDGDSAIRAACAQARAVAGPSAEQWKPDRRVIERLLANWRALSADELAHRALEIGAERAANLRPETLQDQVKRNLAIHGPEWIAEACADLRRRAVPLLSGAPLGSAAERQLVVVAPPMAELEEALEGALPEAAVEWEDRDCLCLLETYVGLP